MKTLAATAMAAGLAGCQAGFDPGSVPDAAEGEIVRVEPPCWWVGMKTPLQLLIQGPGVQEYDLKIEGKGLTVKQIHKAPNPAFIFVDVEVSAAAKPGTAWLVFSKGEGRFKLPYEIGQRREGSAERGSFGTGDMIYLINPDRFSDGDPSIDSTATTIEGVHRRRPGGRHGGDIQGMINHLDYIADLGATAIWPTPLLEDNDSSYSYHGYACSDYYRIDPRYGTNELYCEFVRKAHSKGLKVLLDVVTNHCGLMHWWMKDMPFPDWIHMNDPYFTTNHNFSTLLDPNASEHDRKIMTDGWFVPSMPDINLENPFVLKYFQQWAVWWIEYADLDGFRVDTFPYNDKYAMSEWCKAVTDEYPHFNIMGECWIHYPDQLAYWQGGNANKDGFDTHLPTIMDFPLNDAFNSALAKPKRGKGGDIYDIYQSLSHDFIYHDLDNMLIFFANHDCARLGDVIGRDTGSMKIALALLATLRGIPQLYYGDEMMFSTGSSQRDDGKLRMDFPGGWKGDRIDLFSARGREAAAKADTTWASAAELHDYTAKLFNWRKTSSAVQKGKTLQFVPRDNAYGFFRYDGSQTVFVFVNNSYEERPVPWSDYGEIASGLGEGVDIVTGQKIALSDETSVPAKSALVVEWR